MRNQQFLQEEEYWVTFCNWTNPSIITWRRISNMDGIRWWQNSAPFWSVGWKRQSRREMKGQEVCSITEKSEWGIGASLMHESTLKNNSTMCKKTNCECVWHRKQQKCNHNNQMLQIPSKRVQLHTFLHQHSNPMPFCRIHPMTQIHRISTTKKAPSFVTPLFKKLPLSRNDSGI